MPWFRFIIEFTVSACHLWVYPLRFRAAFVPVSRRMTRRHRPAGAWPSAGRSAAG